jgi:chromosome segregation ATPase
VVSVTAQFRRLKPDEGARVLEGYFTRVVEQRERELTLLRQQEELQEQIAELTSETGKLQLVLQQAEHAHEQALLEQQRQHETKLTFLLRQLNDATATAAAAAAIPVTEAQSGTAAIESTQTELQAMAKELYFYKHRSRTLKKQLDALKGLSVDASVLESRDADLPSAKADAGHVPVRSLSMDPVKVGLS